jgi:hypothetical protein
MGGESPPCTGASMDANRRSRYRRAPMTSRRLPGFAAVSASIRPFSVAISTANSASACTLSAVRRMSNSVLHAPVAGVGRRWSERSAFSARA